MLEVKIPQNVTDMISKSIDEMAKATSRVLEGFLCEYCEVKGIKEKELKERLAIAHGTDGSVSVMEGNAALLRRSLVRTNIEGQSITCSFFLAEKDKYPKTLKAIQELKHKNYQQRRAV